MMRLLDLRDDGLGAALCVATGWHRLPHALHAFPDGETLLRLDEDLRGAGAPRSPELTRAGLDAELDKYTIWPEAA